MSTGTVENATDTAHSLVAALRRAVVPSSEDEALNAAIGPGSRASQPTSEAPLVDVGVLVASITSSILESLDDAKAENVVSLDLHGKTSIGDTMVVASGRSNTHVGAIADRLLKTLKDAGRPAPRVQGMPHNDWVLIDTGDVIIHLFRPEVREFYNLEKLWGEDRPAERRAV